MQYLTDLDALTGTTYVIKFQGEEFSIPPISTMKFIEIQKALMELEEIRKFKETSGTVTRVLELCSLIFITATDGKLNANHVKEMTQAQAALLLGHVVSILTGEPQKKNS